MQNDAGLHELAGTMLDGASIDWESAESSAADESMRRVVRALKVIAEIAEVHGSVTLSSNRQATALDTDNLGSARESEAVDPEPLPETLPSWSALRLLEKVGEGAYGEVYRAWDTRLDREVALKLLRRQDSADACVASVVIDEGRMLAQVRHPNVVTVHGADRSAGRVGLWMEFIHGRTLEQVLREQGPFGAQEATLVGLDLCRALSAVHRAGMLHRDIKAHNVMREDGGRIVLMDFGTGLERADDSDDSARGLAGTPLYMAPEVLDGQEASVQSDMYGVGVLLYHLVTRSYPVLGRSVQNVRETHARGERTLLRDARPDLPEPFVKIIERTLSPQPDDRYDSAGAMEAALASAMDVARPVSPASASESLNTSSVAVPRSIWPWRKATIAAGLLVLTAMGSLWLTAGKSEPPVIVVLPFKNLSVEPDSDNFVDGLTDEVIRNLSVIEGLTVRSSTSSFAFKNKPRNPREVGEQLNANLMLEASVLRAGVQLRINAQLVRPADDVVLWSGRFDRELKDIFAIQDEISRSIVNELRLKLGRGQRRYDTNVEAYELYLRARALTDRRSVSTSEKAAELFEQAIARDPAFAPAYAGLANTYSWMSRPTYRGIAFERAHSIMRSAAVKALELDPLLAEAHAAMGVVYSSEFDWPNAEKSFRRAIDLNPSLTHIYTDYSISTLRPLGRFEEAERLMRVALQNDPLSLYPLREIGHLQFSAGRYEEAINTLQRVRSVEPGLPFVESYLARALMFAGRLAEAIPLLEHPTNPRVDELQRTYLAHAYVMAGRRADAERLAAEHQGNPYRLAVIYAALGDKDRAFDALEQMAVAEPRQLGIGLSFPEFSVLRGDPRLASLRHRFGLP